MRCAIIIPARYSSTRFPGKPLALINGKPLIQWTYEQALKVEQVSVVVVATDDERIKRCVEGFGGNAVMTSKDCKSGTDRVAEAAEKVEADIIVNLQGDEPLVCPMSVGKSIELLDENPHCGVATLRYPITSLDAINSQDVVKVVTDVSGYALYFSRYPIPYIRDRGSVANVDITHYKHIGIYVFKREFLFHFTKLPVSYLEMLEGLEQLRILENGYKILVVDACMDSVGVDRPSDIERVCDAIQRYMV